MATMKSNTIVKTRSGLPPLDQNRWLDEEGDSADPFETNYVSPCRLKVSNDPLTAGDTLCAARVYSCMEDHAFLPNSFVEEIIVSYNYELYYGMTGPMFGRMDVLTYLEGAILEHLATNLGLKDCDKLYSSDKSTRQRRGRLLQANFTQQELDTFVGISSNPVDRMDEARANCRNAENVEGTTCIAMVGYLSAFVEIGSVEPWKMERYENEIRRIIHSGMSSNVYVSGGVQRVSFISAGQEQVFSTSSPRPLMSNLEIALVVAALGLFVIIFLLLIYIRRRARNADRRKSIEGGNMITTAPTNLLEEPSKSQRQERANSLDQVPGSLASTDFLALQPQEFSDDDGSAPSARTNAALATLTPLPLINKQRADTSSSPSSYLGSDSENSSQENVDPPTVEEILADVVSSSDEEDNTVAIRRLNKIADIPTEYGN